MASRNFIDKKKNQMGLFIRGLNGYEVTPGAILRDEATGERFASAELANTDVKTKSFYSVS